MTLTFHQDQGTPNSWKVRDDSGRDYGVITRVSDGTFHNQSIQKGDTVWMVQPGPFATLEAAQEAFRVALREG